MDVATFNVVVRCIVAFLQLVVLTAATRLYIVRRSMPFALLLASCGCYVIGQIGWFASVVAVKHFGDTQSTSHAVAYYGLMTFFVLQPLFPILVIWMLWSFLRESSVVRRTRTSNQSLEPTSDPPVN